MTLYSAFQPSNLILFFYLYTLYSIQLNGQLNNTPNKIPPFDPPPIPFPFCISPPLTFPLHSLASCQTDRNLFYTKYSLFLFSSLVSFLIHLWFVICVFCKQIPVFILYTSLCIPHSFAFTLILTVSIFLTLSLSISVSFSLYRHWSNCVDYPSFSLPYRAALLYSIP